MQVTTKFSVDFPALGWGINAGEVRELPEDKEAAAVILAHPDITKVSSTPDVLVTKDVSAMEEGVFEAEELPRPPKKNKHK